MQTQSPFRWIVRSRHHAKSRSLLHAARHRRTLSQSSNPGHADPDKRVHVLGLGNVGAFLAHGLRESKQNPPVTLLFHRASLLDDWDRQKRCITIQTSSGTHHSDGYGVEVLPGSSQRQDSAQTMIRRLVVATKATNTTEALATIKHRLDQDSIVCFAQNGMGMLDELNKALFTDPATRPRYAMGIIGHGLYTLAPFSLFHAGGVMSAGMIDPQFETPRPNKPNESFLQAFVDAEILSARRVSSDEILAIQLEKLAVNCTLSPLSVILKCKYGDLFNSTDRQRNNLTDAISNKLSREISTIIRGLLRHWSAPGKTADMARFFSIRIKEKVDTVAATVSDSYSSMLGDVQNGRNTELRYLNGYLVRQAQLLGLSCAMNKFLCDVVSRPDNRWEHSFSVLNALTT